MEWGSEVELERGKVIEEGMKEEGEERLSDGGLSVWKGYCDEK